jgi:ketosteroid isomerase-like protein
MTTSPAASVADVLRRHLEAVGDDLDAEHEMYTDDAVLEFPQSGERFEGLASFRAWRDQYPDAVALQVLRIRGGGDLWVAECAISYERGPWKPAVSIHELRDGLIVHEAIYTMEPWPAPEWRSEWRAATGPFGRLLPWA